MVLKKSILYYFYLFMYFFFKVFCDTLQLEVESPNSQTPQKFSCTLFGEGHLPQVSIICPLPVPSCKNSKCVLHFPPTEIGSYSEKLFTFQNTGSITCKVSEESFI